MYPQVFDERFQAKYGYWRGIVEQSVAAFLKCGDPQEGFARVRCPDCRHEMFVAFSCKQRCTCPSCHPKRTLLTAIHVAEEVCSPVAHRQVVLTIPKRLRLHARFDRQLLGKLSLSFQSLSAGQGKRYGTGGLSSREAGLPRLSRPEGRRHESGSETEFPDPPAAGLPGRVHTAHSGEGLASDPLLWLLLEQVAWHAEEG